MNRFILIGIMIVGLGLSIAPAAAAPPPVKKSPPPALKNHVKGKLLADTNAIKPGVPFNVGVHLTIDEGWHIYWKNPGDSGLPTKVKFSLPEGFVAGDLRYPLPSEFDQPGDIAGFGYGKAVMLIAQITPPTTLEPAQKFAITADVTFLVCSDVCLPGKAKVTLALPIAADAKPANVLLFQQWMDELPSRAESLDNTHVSVEVAGTLQPDAWGPFSVTLRSDHPFGATQFFGGNLDALLMKDIQLDEMGKEVRVTFQARVIKGQELKISTLPILLTYELSGRKRQGMEVEIPLKP